MCPQICDAGMVQGLDVAVHAKVPVYASQPALFTRIWIFLCWACSCCKAPLAEALTLAKSPRSIFMHSQLPGRGCCCSSVLASSHLQQMGVLGKHAAEITA